MLKLRELRVELGIKQEDLAKIIGVQDYTIGNWERERSEPSIEHLIKLADYFQCSVDELLGREDYGTGNIVLAGEQVSAFEKKLLGYLRKLPMEDQYQALGFIQALAV